MKKSIKLMAALSLLGAICLTSFPSQTQGYAATTAAAATTSGTIIIEYTVRDTGEILDKVTYAAGTLTVGDTLPVELKSFAGYRLTDAWISNPTTEINISELDKTLTVMYVVDETTEPSTTEPSTTEPSTTEPSTTEPSTTEPSTTEPSTTEPSTTEPSTTEPSTTEPSTTEPSTTEPSTTEPSTTEPSTTEPSTTEPSTTEPSVTPASITVSDKVMTVGDKLTEEIILDWATFSYEGDYISGFEVIGEPIQVDGNSNKLLEAGSHQIRYYLTDLDGKLLAEKTMTLTVNEPTAVVPDEEAKDSGKTPEKPTTKNPVEPTKELQGTKKEMTQKRKTLPATGEQKTNGIIGLSGVVGLALAGGALVRRNRQRK